MASYAGGADRVFGPFPHPIFEMHHDVAKDESGRWYVAVLTKDRNGIIVYRFDRIDPDDPASEMAQSAWTFQPTPFDGYGAPRLTVLPPPDGGCVLSAVGQDLRVRLWRIHDFDRWT